MSLPALDYFTSIIFHLCLILLHSSFFLKRLKLRIEVGDPILFCLDWFTHNLGFLYLKALFTKYLAFCCFCDYVILSLFLESKAMNTIPETKMILQVFPGS